MDSDKMSIRLPQYYSSVEENPKNELYPASDPAALCETQRAISPPSMSQMPALPQLLASMTEATLSGFSQTALLATTAF